MAGFSLPALVSLLIAKNNSRETADDDQPSTDKQFSSQTEVKRSFLTLFGERHAGESCLQSFNEQWKGVANMTVNCRLTVG